MKDGGPAFPEREYNFDCGIRIEIYVPGMTMRQYYKAKLATASMTDILTDLTTGKRQLNLNEAIKLLDDMADISGRGADFLIAEDEAHAKKEG